MAYEDMLLPLLQNIEFGIISVYRKYPKMLDHQVLAAVEFTIDYYVAQQRNREPRDFNLDQLSSEVSENIISILKTNIEKLKKPEFSNADSYYSIGNIIDALKTIKNSIAKWTKMGGRQGYLSFVAKYIV